MLPNNLPMAKASPTTEDIHRVPERLVKRHISNRRPRWPIARDGFSVSGACLGVDKPIVPVCGKSHDLEGYCF